MEKRHGEVKTHPSDILVEELNLIAPISSKSKKSVIRQLPQFESDKAFSGMMKEDEIK